MKTKMWKAGAIAALAGACTAQSAWAQAEACGDAGSHPITVGVPATGNFTGSTNDGPTGCGGTGNLTQWWTFTAPATARYTISMCSSAQSDTHLGVTLASASCAGALTYIACNDDACGLGSQVVVDLTMGEVYRLRTATFGAVSNGGGYAVLITQDSGVAPMGDDCGTPLVATLGTNMGNNNGATGTNDNGCGGTLDTNDVYFSFTTGADGFYRFSTCASDFDTVMSVHTACPATSLNQVTGGCLESASAPIALCGNRGSTIVTGLDASQTVFVRVAGTTGQSVTGTPGSTVPQRGFGNFDLNIEQILTPANDLCGNAELISSFPFAATVANVAATDDGALGGCTLFGDIWYTFTAPANGLAVLNETSAQNAGWAAYDADPCGNLAASILCDLLDGGRTFPVTMGTTYWVRLGADTLTTLRTTSLAFSIDIAVTPANDLCANAQVVNSFPFTATVANVAATGDGLLGGCERFGDVWYELVAPGDGAFTLNETGLQTAAFGVYEADPCGGATPFLLCNTTQVGLAVFPVFSGQSYWVRVGTAALATARTTPLALDFQFTAAPANDLCDDAATLDLSMGGSVTIDARAALNDADIDCNGAATEAIAGVWYTFTTGPDGGVLNVNETSSASVATQLYTGDCNALVTVVGSCSTLQNRNFTLNASTTYSMIMSMSGSTRPAVAYAFTYSFTPAMGACCTAGVCSISTQSACVGGGGTYVGDNAQCTPQPNYTSPDAPLQIVDGVSPNPGVTSMTINVADSGTITSIGFVIDLFHSWAGDTTARVTSPMATTATLWERPGRSPAGDCTVFGSPFGNSSDFNNVYTIADDGTIGSHAAIIAGPAAAISNAQVWQANSCGDVLVDLNTAFAGQSIMGTWTLTISDYGPGDTGTLRGFGLLVNGGAPVCPAAPPCPGDFNDDGVVDLADLLDFLGDWNPNLGGMGMGLPGDINDDGVVDLADLLDFLGEWNPNLGSTCP